jgi:hypothetical protein
MNNTNTGGPAFPGVEYKQPGGVGVSVMTIVGGMTLRDYFAAKAMQSMNSREDYRDASASAIALDAYALADAMIYAREAA